MDKNIIDIVILCLVVAQIASNIFVVLVFDKQRLNLSDSETQMILNERERERKRERYQIAKRDMEEKKKKEEEMRIANEASEIQREIKGFR